MVIKMKKISLLFLIMVILSGCQTSTRFVETSTGYGNYNDKDWNESFYDNCRLPKNSLEKIEENGNKFLRFKLKNGQKGRCKSDRISGRGNAPYQERAELRQRINFKTNSTYEITFKIRFIEGFEGSRETFFQVHQWQNDCQVGPPIMLQMHYGEIILYATKTIDHRKRYYVKKYGEGPKIEELLNKWQRFKITYSSLKKTITISLNNNIIFNNIKFVPYPCGIPHIKFGIYRPGNIHNPIKTSIVDFDKFQIKEL